MAAKIMNLEEYRIHRGCSKVAVWKAVIKGRISAKTTVNAQGRNEYEIDPIIADAEWIQNTKRNKSAKLTHNSPSLGVGHPSKQQSEALKIVKEAKKKESEEKRQAVAQERLKKKEAPHGGKDSKNVLSVTFGGESGQNEGGEGQSLYKREMLAKIRKSEASAELDEIRLAKEKKQLVIVDEIEDVISEKIANARDSLLHMPKSFRVTFQEAPQEYGTWIDDFIGAVLQKLSGIEQISKIEVSDGGA